MDLRYPEFRNFLILAIGNKRKKQEFADDAGISVSHLSRMLNNDIISRPSRSTLRKIANASEGRVSYRDLLFSCEYASVYSDPAQVSEKVIADSCSYSEPNNIVASFISGISFDSKANNAVKFNSLIDILNAVRPLYGKAFPYPLKFNILDSMPYTGNHHGAAEECANIVALWECDNYKCEFGFVIYYFITQGGGYVLSDAVFDLNSLIENNHPLGVRKAKETNITDNADNLDIVLFLTHKNSGGK